MEMQVRVKVYSVLKEVVGSGLVLMEIGEEGTLLDALNELSERYGAIFREKTGRSLKQALEKRFNLFVNGKVISLPGDANLKLKGNDEIVILQPVGGGTT